MVIKDVYPFKELCLDILSRDTYELSVAAIWELLQSDTNINFWNDTSNSDDTMERARNALSWIQYSTLFLPTAEKAMRQYYESIGEISRFEAIMGKDK